ncbi:chromatin structure-remodeling complex subunit RSC7 [Tieghemiomyces parasiticus]|uniref:Chromatin structure-remodeling complex subunit RSC7 n=1 Tax=Tieghemiomyces parasiticus TaxID=78921 RepID=A0A9W8A8X0_9FUNG|nr:chromatin structure-remodeling complex subunit RSC7 [Tieghemiomyces parasiticus]
MARHTVTTPATGKRGRGISNVQATPTKVAQYETDPDGPEEHMTDPDPQGETKITPLGELLGGREYKCPAFQLPDRHPGRYYLLSMDVVRFGCARDTYVLFNKIPGMVRLELTEDEKMLLIQRGIVPKNFRSRKISFLTARSAFVRFGHLLVKGGKEVTDDYYEEVARKKAAEDQARRREKIAQREKTRSPPPPLLDAASSTVATMGTPVRRSRLPGDTLHGRRGSTPLKSSPAPSGLVSMGSHHQMERLMSVESTLTDPGHFSSSMSPPPSGAQPELVVDGKNGATVAHPATPEPEPLEEHAFPLHADRDAGMFNAAQSVRDLNQRLRLERRRKPRFWDPHTYVHQVPANTQPTTVVTVLDRSIPSSDPRHTGPVKAEPVRFVTVPAPSGLPTCPLLDPNAEPTATNVLADADEAYPLAIMPGQYQGLLPADATRWNRPMPLIPAETASRVAVKAQVLALAQRQLPIGPPAQGPSFQHVPAGGGSNPQQPAGPQRPPVPQGTHLPHGDDGRATSAALRNVKALTVNQPKSPGAAMTGGGSFMGQPSPAGSGLRSPLAQALASYSVTSPSTQ